MLAFFFSGIASIFEFVCCIFSGLPVKHECMPETIMVSREIVAAWSSSEK